MKLHRFFHLRPPASRSVCCAPSCKQARVPIAMSCSSVLRPSIGVAAELRQMEMVPASLRRPPAAKLCTCPRRSHGI